MWGQPPSAVQPGAARRPSRCQARHYNIPVPEVSTPEAPAREAAPAPRFTLRQRIILRIIIFAGYWFIRLTAPMN